MKISIITAVYNNINSLQDAIDSVYSQTHKDVEYIIVDGNSSDGTIDLIKKNEHKITKWISKKDSGIYEALNKGIEMASGEIIGFLHSDDIFASKDVLQVINDEFIKTNTDSIYGDLLYVSKNDTNNIVRYWQSKAFKKSMLRKGWMPPHPTFFVKKSIYTKYGKFDTNFKIAADYDLMLRFLGQKNISTSYLQKIITKMRVGGVSNNGMQNIITKSHEDYIALKRNSVGGLLTLLLKNISKVPQFIFKKTKMKNLRKFNF